MAPTTKQRRNGAPVEQSQQAAPKMPPPSRSSWPMHPILPTSTEALLLAIYPATLLLGSIYSSIDPASRHAPYDPIAQSHPPEFAPSYFAKKSNLLNVFFVKVGWFWTTAGFFAFVLLHRSFGPDAITITPKRAQAVLRYLGVTAWWMIMTQWFFGPAIIDRSFRLTGGACEYSAQREGQKDPKTIVTAIACKTGGGKWVGGHDISGHVFMLVLGNAFLLLEILPVVMGIRGLREERLVRKDGNVTGGAHDVSGTAEEEVVEEVRSSWGATLGLGVAGVMWWMLLMTATYFHTWFEKVCAALNCSVDTTNGITVYWASRCFLSDNERLPCPSCCTYSQGSTRDAGCFVG